MLAEQVTELVRSVCSADSAAVTWVGAGHWSQCFAFDDGGEHLVIRVGHNLEDFEKDQIASTLASSTLPIPQVLTIGEADLGYYAISTRVPGEALEQAAHWDQLIEPTVDLLGAIAQAPTASFHGWGRWNATGVAPSSSWRSFLLAVSQDPSDSRIHGWRAKLAESSEASALFGRGLTRLDELATNDVPRCLVHNDLINRNVHVVRNTITGVFDWGNSMMGDPVYDIALFRFWQPWLPLIKGDAVIAGIRQRFAGTSSFDQRLDTCLLHIGLEHMAYHASLNDFDEVMKVASRIEELVPSA